MVFSTYKTYGICWLTPAHCYWVYDIKTAKTLFYSDEPLETIKRRLDSI